MPRVKIDYIVSFSSEDSENPASNLLEKEVSKKKWLCSKGEPSCSVVLQLTKAIEIESITIGAHHAASVEVLVGLSEKPNDPFEVLVPSCMLLSPAEARRGTGEQRVRSFSGVQLAAARRRRWDRVRVVCAQPYNRHCEFGLAFVHVYSPETAPDEDEFRPGELFALYSQRSAPDAQIRQASVDAIKNNSDESSKLLRVPINKASANDRRVRPGEDETINTDRKKENLMYTDDDRRPRARVDRVVDRHRRRQDERADRPAPAEDTGGARGGGHDSERGDKRKRPAAEPLARVVFALSGFQNPRRAALRAAGLALGARYRPAWAPAVTHLVCAFPNTPKLREARAAGWAGAAVTPDWLQECERAGRCLPTRPFAVDPADRARPADRAPPADDDDTEVDTDDEIERVLQQQRKKTRSRSVSAADDADDADDPYGGDTDADRRPSSADSADAEELPNFFEGMTFALAEDLDPAYDRELIARYIRAYGGLLVDGAGAARLHVCGCGGACGAGACVAPRWLWACHRARRLLPAPALT